MGHYTRSFKPYFWDKFIAEYPNLNHYQYARLLAAISGYSVEDKNIELIDSAEKTLADELGDVIQKMWSWNDAKIWVVLTEGDKALFDQRYYKAGNYSDDFLDEILRDIKAKEQKDGRYTYAVSLDGGLIQVHRSDAAEIQPPPATKKMSGLQTCKQITRLIREFISKKYLRDTRISLEGVFDPEFIDWKKSGQKSGFYVNGDRGDGQNNAHTLLNLNSGETAEKHADFINLFLEKNYPARFFKVVSDQSKGDLSVKITGPRAMNSQEAKQAVEAFVKLCFMARSSRKINFWGVSKTAYDDWRSRAGDLDVNGSMQAKPPVAYLAVGLNQPEFDGLQERYTKFISDFIDSNYPAALFAIDTSRQDGLHFTIFDTTQENVGVDAALASKGDAAEDATPEGNKTPMVPDASQMTSKGVLLFFLLYHSVTSGMPLSGAVRQESKPVPADVRPVLGFSPEQRQVDADIRQSLAYWKDRLASEKRQLSSLFRQMKEYRQKNNRDEVHRIGLQIQDVGGRVREIESRIARVGWLREGLRLLQMIPPTGDAAAAPHGGIDLNAKKMGLDVAKDGKGVEMTFDPAMVAEFRQGNFTGVEGIILKIVPIESPLALLGL